MGLTVSDSGIFPWLVLSLMSNVPGLVVMLMEDWRGWYEHLRKAPFSPPASIQGLVFGGVWFALDVLDGFGYWQGWRNPGGASYGVWVVFWLSAIGICLLKAAWTPVFFGFRMIRMGLLVLVLYLALAILNTAFGYLLDTASGAILTPRLAWLLFAFALNLYVVMANEVHAEDMTCRASKEKLSGREMSSGDEL